MICSRRTTRPAFDISNARRSNSRAASTTGFPDLLTVRASGSSWTAPTWITPCGVDRGPAAKDRADPGYQFAHREWLHDVVVGAQLEPDDLVDLLSAGSQHHDRDVRLRTELAAEVLPVTVGEHHVQQDEVGSERVKRIAGCLHRGRDDRVEALPAEMRRQRLGDALLVLHKQDARRHRVHHLGEADAHPDGMVATIIFQRSLFLTNRSSVLVP